MAVHSSLFFIAFAFTSLHHLNCELVDLNSIQVRLKSSHNLIEAFENNRANLFVTPTALQNALAVPYFCSKGNTRKQIHPLFGINSVRPEDIINELNKKRMYLKSRIYINKNWQMRKSIKTKLNALRTDQKEIDFLSGKKAVQEINRDAAIQTRQKKMPTILRAFNVDKDTLGVLLNTLRFKLEWQRSFNHKTVNGSFKFNNGLKSFPVTMMTTFEILSCGQVSHLHATVVEKELDKKGMKIVLILPNQFNASEKLEKKLMVPSLKRMSRRLSRKLVVLRLPVFRLEEIRSLRTPMLKAGMRQAFTVRANMSFSNNNTEGYIQDFIQNSFISINPSGVESHAETLIQLQTLVKGGKKKSKAKVNDVEEEEDLNEEKRKGVVNNHLLVANETTTTNSRQPETPRVVDKSSISITFDRPFYYAITYEATPIVIGEVKFPF